MTTTIETLLKEDLIACIDLHLEELKEGEYANRLLQNIIYEENIEALRHYVNKGLDVNLRMSLNKTVMHYSLNVSVPFMEEMIMLGVNPHATDINGDTLLLLLAEKNINEDLQVFLMSNGLNPYAYNYKGYNCFHYMSARTEGIENTKTFYASRGFIQVDPPVSNLIKEGQLDLALSSIYFTIHNLGGLNVLSNNIHVPNYAEIFSQLQNLFSLLKRYEEANALIRLFLNTRRNKGAQLREKPLNCYTLLFEKDYDTLFKCLDVIEESLHSFTKQKNSTVLIKYLVSLISKDEDLIQKNKEHLKKSYLNKNLMPYFVRRVMFSGNPAYLQQDEDTMASFANVTNIRSQASEMKLIEALYYLAKEDSFTAEVKLRELIDISIQNNFLFKEYETAQTLIDFIQQETLVEV